MWRDNSALEQVYKEGVSILRGGIGVKMFKDSGKLPESFRRSSPMDEKAVRLSIAFLKQHLEDF